MSEEENKSSVAAEEPMPMEQNGHNEEPAAASKAGSGDQEDTKETKTEEKSSPSPKKSPKKSPQKEKKDDKEADGDGKGDAVSSEEDDDDEEDGEEKLGLLEQPIVLEEGSKRVRKKVERMEMKQITTPKDKKLEIGEGLGTKLGEIPRVELHLGKTLADDLKPLHRLMFNRPGTTNEIKRNIRKFSGFTFEKSSTDYDKKMVVLNKCTISMLKTMSEIVDIERSGTKEIIVERLMSFLMSPKSSGKAMPKPKRRKSGSGKGEKRKRSKKQEGGEKKPKSPKKKPAKSKEEVESDEDDDDDEKDSSADEEEKEEEKQNKEEQSGSDEDSSDEEEKPPKKKAKKETPKKEAPKKTPKKEVKKEKKETKKAAPKKTEKKKTPKKTKPKKAPVSDSSDDSDSEDEPLVVRKKPPTDDEVREAVKQILDGANLEEVTMKTVCRKVYEKYPDFDLTPRKDFIKATVKQIIR